MDGSGKSFSKDSWGVFDDNSDENVLSGGITRVIQGGNVVEKGACSLTLIRRGILSAERAAAIRSRQDLEIQAGDVYSAAALSIVLHSRSPMVPTFRSDVRIFFVQSNKKSTMAWFGGGADLTPYVSPFHPAIVPVEVSTHQISNVPKKSFSISSMTIFLSFTMNTETCVATTQRNIRT